MRLQNKLFLSLVAISTLLVVLMLGLMQWSVQRGMLEYVNVQEAARLQPMLENLADVYGRNGSWKTLQADPRQYEQLLWRSQDPAERPLLPPHIEEQRRQRLGNPPRFSHRARKPRPVVIDLDGQLVLGRALPEGEVRKLPIVVEGETVGWLALPSRKRLTEGYELNFVEQQLEALLAIGALVIGLAMVFAYLLARHLQRPISALAQAASTMTQGDYAPVLDVKRRDELGQLARDFSELARSLQQSDAARRRWFADVSHELRTPLAILRAEIEAMLDGVRPIDRGAVESLHQETEQLTKLVDDLNTLSNAELGALQYHKQWLALDKLVESQLEAHRSVLAAGKLELQWDNQAPGVSVYGDRTRLCQLLDNLLGNSRKYTDAPGCIRVSLALEQGELLLQVEDSTPGVPVAALPVLFDHLYRVDASRNRATGGSGLGLAICRRIVEAHGGRIEAANSSLGGLLVCVRFAEDVWDDGRQDTDRRG